MQIWYTRQEAADYCRVSVSTISRWVKSGRLRAFDRKYYMADLDAAVMNKPLNSPWVPSNMTLDGESTVTGIALERIVPGPELTSIQETEQKIAEYMNLTPEDVSAAAQAVLDAYAPAPRDVERTATGRTLSEPVPQELPGRTGIPTSEQWLAFLDLLDKDLEARKIAVLQKYTHAEAPDTGPVSGRMALTTVPLTQPGRVRSAYGRDKSPYVAYLDGLQEDRYGEEIEDATWD